MKTLALIHTGPVIIRPLSDIARQVFAGLRLVNLMDDSIVAEIEREGRITEAVRERMNNLSRSAASAGADAAIVTCSSISDLTEPMAEAGGLPTYKIDEAMAEAAVEIGPRIGVIATLPTTLEPTCAQIERKGRAAARAVSVTRELCREAFEALSAGDEKRHDEVVAAAVRRLAADHDVVVLAQASMARISDRLSGYGVPVLTSPELGFRKVRGQLAEAGLLPVAA